MADVGRQIDGKPASAHAKQARAAGSDSGPTAKAAVKSARKPPRGDVFPFGNYPAYYAKRLPGGVPDPRLVMFKREW